MADGGIHPADIKMTATIHAKDQLSSAVRLSGGVALPDTIQWMPPGKHTITARKGEESVEVEVTVTPRTAEVMQALLDELKEGGGDTPYLDFNHEDRDASARVKGFVWGGDDPTTGGVRAAVEWTEPGKAALTGKSYRRFSPSFFVDANGEVTGAPLNMGGLVNRAAFKTIQPIWSRHGGPESPTQDKDSMDPSVKELADLKAALAASNAEVAALNAKLAIAGNDAAIKAKDAEITGLKAEITGLKTQVTEQRAVHAKAVVAAAVAAGKLPPQATALHAKWVETLTANPELGETLTALQPTAAPAPGFVTAGAPPTSNQPVGTKAEQFVAAFKAKATELKGNKAEALRAVLTTHGEGHREWVAAKCKPALD